MVERWSYAVRQPPDAGAGQILVRLPVDDRVERAVDEVAWLRASGAAEIVIDAVADAGVDHTLDLYSRIAEGVAGRAEQESPGRAGPR